MVQHAVMQLRPPTPADEPFLDHVRRPEVAGEFNFFEDAAEERAAAAVERLIVALDDGTPIGSVSWHGIPYGPNRRSVAWNVGITIVPEHRGKGYGAAAQRALAEAATDTENVAEQRALERAGFRREGVLRGAQHRAGGWRDLVLFARLREDAG